ncbi:hypothetical protein N0V90_011540 [Kalmusia sp. IMI 367209]|nr:hypothetical protein N0V90_011540 [Kalmusia sp. IMI 367209]
MPSKLMVNAKQDPRHIASNLQKENIANYNGHLVCDRSSILTVPTISLTTGFPSYREWSLRFGDVSYFNADIDCNQILIRYPGTGSMQITTSIGIGSEKSYTVCQLINGNIFQDVYQKSDGIAVGLKVMPLWNAGLSAVSLESFISRYTK